MRVGVRADVCLLELPLHVNAGASAYESDESARGRERVAAHADVIRV